MPPEKARKYHLRLYVSGHNAKSQQAISMLSQVCDEYLKNECEIEVVDVLKNPELAAREDIMVTPAIFRTIPMPAKRIIGELVDKEKLWIELNVAEE